MTTTGEPPLRRRARRTAPASPLRNAVEWVVILAFALGVAFAVRTWVMQPFYIPSGSMEHTLEIRDRVLVNKLSYRLHPVHRGDIVVFERPPGEADAAGIKDLIKRVIAVGGDTIEGRQGQVYVNGKPVREPYVPAGEQTDNLPRQTIPAGSVWVMGDNRTNSRDSRFFGAIPTDLVVGRAFVKIWPLGDIRTL